MPTKKLKKYEKEYQMMRANQLQQEDPLDRYKVMACQVFGHLPFRLFQKNVLPSQAKSRIVCSISMLNDVVCF